MLEGPMLTCKSKKKKYQTLNPGQPDQQHQEPITQEYVILAALLPYYLKSNK